MEELANEFECCICLNISVDPLVTPCEHIYCKKCIEDWLEQKNNCALCKKELSKEKLSALPRILANLFKNLTVPCPFVKNGCSNMLKLSEVTNHEDICIYKLSNEWEAVNCESTLNGANAQERDCIKVLKANLDDCNKHILLYQDFATHLAKMIGKTTNGLPVDTSNRDGETSNNDVETNYPLLALREDIELFVTMKNSTIYELNLQLKHLKEQLKSTEDLAKQTENSLKDVISNLKDDIQTLIGRIHSLQDEGAPSGSKMNEMKQSSSKAVEDIQCLQFKVFSQEIKLNELMEELTAKESKVAAMEETLSKKEAETAEMRTRIQEQKQSIASLDSVLRGIMI